MEEGKTLGNIAKELRRTENTEATKRERINNTDLLKDNGIRIIHVFDKNDVRNENDKDLRNVTIAYRRTSRKNGKKGHFIEMATAICNEGDTFSKKIGTKVAAERLLNGQSIMLPVGNANPQEVILNTFLY